MKPKNSSRSSQGQYQNAKPMRKRRRIRTPAGHPTDAELIAAYKGPITRCPDGEAMGSRRSFDMGLAI